MKSNESSHIPQWLDELETCLQSRENCIGFTFNHDDLMLKEGVPIYFEEYLKKYFKEHQYELILELSLSEGLRFSQADDVDSVIKQFERHSEVRLHDPQKPEGPTTLALLRGIDRLLRKDVISCALILRYAEHLVPSNGVNGGVPQSDQIIIEEMLDTWARNPVIRSSRSVVCLLVREGHIADRIRERWKTIKIDLPSHVERERFCSLLVAANQSGKNSYASLEDNLSVSEVARLTSGLPLRGIEHLFRRSAIVGDKKLTRQAVKSAKAVEISRMCGELIEVLDTDDGFDAIAGLAHVKKYFSMIKNQIKNGNGRDIVRAVLLVGVPGVGKSFSVRVLSKEIGFNCLTLRSVRSMWVGESEKNLERAFNAIEGLAPTVVFLDELDQSLGQRGAQGDSGVSARMLARLWEFIATESLRGRVIFVAATNMPSLLDPATLDRFGATVPYLLPTAKELGVMLPVLAQQLGLSIEHTPDLAEVAAMLTAKRISPRQTLDILSMARSLAIQSTVVGSNLQSQWIKKAAASFHPNANINQLERITLEALDMTTFDELLPWYGAQLPIDLPPYTDRVLNPNTGELDRDAIQKMLSQYNGIL